MSSPTRPASKRAIARIQRLCCLGVGSEMLIPVLLREIEELVPFHTGMFLWSGPRQELANMYATGSAAVLLPVYMKEYHNSRERDLLLTFTEAMRAHWPGEVGDFFELTLKVDRRDFLRSDLFNQLYRPVGGEQVLMLRVREHGKPLGALGLFRGEHEAPFTAAERGTLQAIAGFVAHGMSQEVVTDSFADSEERSLLIADHDGRIRHAGTEALQLLLMALHPRWSPATNWHAPRETVPEIKSLCQDLGKAGRDVIACPPVMRRRNHWGEFILRGYRLDPARVEETACCIGITVERRLPRMMATFRHVEQLPLTTREKQLCLLLARDPARRDLASTAGVSANTVITHLRNIYAKLGVHGRAALIDLLRTGDCAGERAGAGGMARMNYTSR